MQAKNENARVVSPQNIPTHLKLLISCTHALICTQKFVASICYGDKINLPKWCGPYDVCNEVMMIMIGEIQKIHSSNYDGCDSDSA